MPILGLASDHRHLIHQQHKKNIRSPKAPDAKKNQ